MESLFFRINNAGYLLTTRRGRCGEFANAFSLLLRSLGYETRLIWLFRDDHIWVEVFDPPTNRFVHCDPCEGLVDKPLVYEQGWHKHIKRVFAASVIGCYDVTQRYTVINLREWADTVVAGTGTGTVGVTGTGTGGSSAGGYYGLIGPLQPNVAGMRQLERLPWIGKILDRVNASILQNMQNSMYIVLRMTMEVEDMHKRNKEFTALTPEERCARISK